MNEARDYMRTVYTVAWIWFRNRGLDNLYQLCRSFQVDAKDVIHVLRKAGKIQ